MMIFSNSKTQNILRLTLSFLVVALTLTVIFTSGCGYLEDVKSRRTEQADDPDQPITFGVAWPFSEFESQLREGIDLAADRINSQGGVNGREIKLIFKDDHRDVTRGRLVAQQFADNPDVFAVIGHYNSYVSLPAATIYQLNGLLMINPASTGPKITDQGYDLIFRSIPDDIQNGTLLAEYCRQEGYARLGMLYEESSYGRGLANAVEKHAHEIGLNVEDRFSYTPGEVEISFFLHAIARWKRSPVDAVIFAGGIEEAALFLNSAHRRELELPFVTGDAVNAARLWDEAGTVASGVVMVKAFHPDQQHSDAREFVENFKKRYGKTPGNWAAQGYDALNLLAEAARRAKSARPEKMAAELRKLKNFPGVTGKYNFNENGNLVGNTMNLLRLRDGELVPVEDVTGDEATE